METDSKYRLRCKALESAYGYLHKSMKGAKHLNAGRAANFIERVETWLDQNAPIPVTPWIAAAAHSDGSYAGGSGVKFRESRPLSDPEVAARKLLEIANGVEAVQDGRIHIEKISSPFLQELKGSPAEYKVALDLAIARGWLSLHESGTYVKFTPAGADLFA